MVAGLAVGSEALVKQDRSNLTASDFDIHGFGELSTVYKKFYAFFGSLCFFGRIGPRAKEGVTRIRESTRCRGTL